MLRQPLPRARAGTLGPLATVTRELFCHETLAVGLLGAFAGISRMGGANATNDIVAGTIGILVLAVILDVVLNLITRVTTSRGIRV